MKGRTNIIRSVRCIFGATRLGSGRRGSFGAFWFVTRKILYWNWWGKCVLCRTLETGVSKGQGRGKMGENKVKKRESGQGASRDGRVHSCRMSAGSRGSSRQRQTREVIARGSHEARKEAERHEREMTWRQMPRTIEDNICTFGPNALDSWAFSRSQDLIVSASSR